MNAPRDLVLAGVWPEAATSSLALEKFTSRVFVFIRNLGQTLSHEGRTYENLLEDLNFWKTMHGLGPKDGYVDLVQLPRGEEGYRGIVWTPYRGIHARYPKEYRGSPPKQLRLFFERQHLLEWLRLYHEPRTPYLVHSEVFTQYGERKPWLLFVTS